MAQIKPTTNTTGAKLAEEVYAGCNQLYAALGTSFLALPTATPKLLPLNTSSFTNISANISTTNISTTPQISYSKLNSTSSRRLLAARALQQAAAASAAAPSAILDVAAGKCQARVRLECALQGVKKNCAGSCTQA